MSPLIYELPGILRVSPLSGRRSDAPAGEEGEKIKEEAQIETLQPQSGDVMWIRRVALGGSGPAHSGHWPCPPMLEQDTFILLN